MNGGRVLDYARLDWAGGAPRSAAFDDVYFSGYGLSETRHVFLDGNALSQRFKTAARFSIGELGFGSGLNMLAAAALWRQSEKPAGARLHLFSVEFAPFDPQSLERAHEAWPELAELSATLRRRYPPPIRGFHKIWLSDDISLTLAFGEAADMLREADGAFDAWFLDGFAPSKNAAMWSPQVFNEIARLSAPGATLATFSVAAAVRRGVEDAGFSFAKLEGFGRKKEMLVASLAHAPAKSASLTPWFDRSDSAPLAHGSEIAIIGAGIAGASLAHELRALGMSLVLIDPKGVAGAASGNPAGLISPRIDLGDTPASRFFVLSYVHALSTIARLEESGLQFFNRCGVLKKFTNDDDRSRAKRIIAEKLLPEGWAALRDDGLFFPQAGVVDPAAYCAALAGETPLWRTRIRSITETGDSLILSSSDGERRRFDAAFIANGVNALDFSACRTLPLSPVKGQVDFFPNASAPPYAIAAGPYAAPAPKGGLIIGATYDHDPFTDDPRPDIAATHSNIDATAEFFGGSISLDPAAATPRAAFRCQTPDRIPVAGPLPDWEFFGAEYDDLRTGGTGPFAPARRARNLYILAGLGSRGLVTAPYCAAIAAARLGGAPIPSERNIADAVDPARFFIRELKRARTIRPQ